MKFKLTSFRNFTHVNPPPFDAIFTVFIAWLLGLVGAPLFFLIQQQTIYPLFCCPQRVAYDNFNLSHSPLPFPFLII